MGFDVAVEIIANKVIVAVIYDRADEGGELVCITESAGADGVEDLLEVRIDGVLAVVVGVAEVLDVFREVAEEENVRVANFAGNFDLQIVSLERITVMGIVSSHWHHRKYR